MLRDLRFALRSFMRAPAFTAIAAITLALGIGANAAIFSVVDSVVLRPLPYPSGDQIVVIEQVRPGAKGQGGNASFPDFDDWRKQNQVFSQVAGFRGDSLVLTRPGEPPQQLDGQVVTANLFELLGVSPRVGRGFAAGEDTDGKHQVAVLTHGGWLKVLGGDPDVVGKTITLDATPYTVIGILPASFRFLATEDDVAIFVPTPRGFDRELKGARGAHYMNVMGRLKDGVSLDAAAANMKLIGDAQAAQYPDTNAGRTVRVTPLRERLSSEVRPALLILLGAVGFVLLIACANVANLLLARASARQREIAIRTALGASRGRIVRQLLTESVLLSIVGAALGVALAMWGLDVLRELVPKDIARYQDVAIDARVLLFTATVAVATGLGFGLVPALQAAGHDPGETLKEAGTRSVRGPRQRMRSVFVVAEIAIATVLLVGAGLMLRSFHKVSNVDPGFNPDDLLIGGFMLPDTRYKDDDSIRAFLTDFRARLHAVPGAEKVTVSAPLPYSGFNMSFRFTIVGEPPLPPDRARSASHAMVDGTFFDTMGIALRRGRLFTEADDRKTAAPVMIVNEAFVRKHFPDKDPLGQMIVVGWRAGGDVQKEIVGVVADVRGVGLDTEPQAAMYIPFAQAPFNVVTYAVRAHARTGMTEALRSALAAVDPNLPLGDVDTMSDLMGASMAQRRLNTLLLAVFGAVALLLALIGVYGVMSYTVTQRIPEIGIRIALGARPGDVTRMVVGHGLVLAGLGVAVGIAGALAMSKLVAGLLWGVSSTDPATYAVIAGLLVVVAMLASWLPARRAARVDPMMALRAE